MRGKGEGAMMRQMLDSTAHGRTTGDAGQRRQSLALLPKMARGRR
jgi:hypothetical protein